MQIAGIPDLLQTEAGFANGACHLKKADLRCNLALWDTRLENTHKARKGRKSVVVAKPAYTPAEDRVRSLPCLLLRERRCDRDVDAL